MKTHGSTLGSYHKRQKNRKADFYGTWENGIQKRSERINGHTLTYNHITGKWS